MVDITALENHLREKHHIEFNWEAYSQDMDSPDSLHNRLHWHDTSHGREDLSNG